MNARGVVVLAALMAVSPGTVFAQSYAIQGVERYIRVESSSTSQGRRGLVVWGYVYNAYGQSADRVRFVVEGLDAGGQVTSSTIGQVLGTVPALTRTYFEVPVPSGASQYRVRVLSFDPIGRGGGQ
jgi:hypothetical protein